MFGINLPSPVLWMTNSIQTTVRSGNMLPGWISADRAAASTIAAGSEWLAGPVQFIACDVSLGLGAPERFL